MLAPLIGLVLGFIIMVAVLWICSPFPPSRVDRWFRRLQLLSAAAYSLGHGGNDAQKTMGIIAGVLFAGGYISAFRIDLWVILLAHAAIALGTLSGGWRIIHTMGSKITKLQPVGGFAAETAGAISLFTATHLGVPVSTTHTITGAIIGVGSIRRLSAVRWGVAGRIVWAWILTIPAAAFIAALRVLAHGRDDRAIGSGGELDCQQRAARRLVRGGDSAAVQLDEVLHDREAEAGAARIPPVARARLVDPIEPLEDPRQIRLGNARTIVSDRDHDASRTPLRPHHDRCCLRASS